MIVDLHTTCGNLPTTGRNWSLDDLAGWADLSGVDVMVVESADARIHSDEGPHEGLLAACRASGGRFLPAATIGLESHVRSIELARSARRRGFACVVLHGKLFEESRVLHQVLDALEEGPLPVYRELGWEGDEYDCAYRIARQHRGISFVFAPQGFQALELNHRFTSLPNVYLCTAHTLYSTGQLEVACGAMGSGHVLYGSDSPRQHPARPLGTIIDSELSEGDRDMVLGCGAVELLAEHGVSIPKRPSRYARPMPPCAIIDTHGHIGADHRRLDFDFSVDAVLRYLERAGGEAIYVSSNEGVFGDVEWGNRQVAEAMRAHPGRIRGYCVVNPWMGKACLEDVRRCHALGFSGLKPYPGSFGHDLSDAVMDPVWDLAGELGLAVLCHADGSDIRRVLEKRPHARILAAHMSFPWEEKAELARRYPNVVLEISGAGVRPDDLIRAVELAGEDSIVFGSDLTPHALGWTLMPLLCSGLPQSTLRAILRENALRFFGRA